jgi:hypothetical protein
MCADSDTVQPTLPSELIQKIEDELSPEMGANKGQITRNIIYSWLSEHGYLDKMLEKDNSK